MLLLLVSILGKEWEKPGYLRGLLVKWFDWSRGGVTGQLSIFDRFVFRWIAFEAWCSNTSRKNTGFKKWVKRSAMKDKFRNKRIHAAIKNHLDQLVGQQIPNRLGGKPKILTNSNNFEQLIDVLFQIRNNLFHGHKSPDDREDKTLVGAAYGILGGLLDPFVDELRENSS